MGNSQASKSEYDYIFVLDNPYRLQTEGCEFHLAKNYHQDVEQRLKDLQINLNNEKQKIPENTYEIFSYKSDWPFVAVLGLFDKGKTWLINQSSQMALPSGELFHTQGLSFKLGTKLVPAIFVDTAGSHAPVSQEFLNDVSKEEKYSVPDAIALKKFAENFQRELVLRLSDIIIFVVGELTWPDQEYIESSIEKLSKLQKIVNTPITILHNFKTCKSLEELEKRKQCYIEKNFNVHLDSTKKYYYEMRTVNNDRQIQIRHYFMMNHTTTVGEKFNRDVIKDLVSICIGRYNTSTGGNLIAKRVIETVRSCLKPLKLENSLDVNLYVQKEESLKLFLKSNEFYDPKQRRTLSSNFNYCLGPHFQPKYDIQILDPGTFRIIIDIPGNYNIKTQIVKQDIIFKGNKLLGYYQDDNWKEYKADSAYHQAREFGEFELMIPLLDGFEKVTLNDIKRKRGPGIFEVIVKNVSESVIVED